MRLFTVDGGIEVFTSSEDEGIDAVQHTGKGSGVLGNRQEVGDASCLDDGLAVFAADAGVVVGHGAGDADDGILMACLIGAVR